MIAALNVFKVDLHDLFFKPHAGSIDECLIDGKSFEVAVSLAGISFSSLGHKNKSIRWDVNVRHAGSIASD